MTVQQIQEQMQGKKIGIVIPCHNYGRYLAKCLDSIYDQTLPADKIIVVDDASTDETAEVCKRYPKVQYIKVDFHHANRARNEGASHLYGFDFLLFFDADNYMNANFLQESMRYLIENPDASYAYCDRIIINEKGKIGRSQTFPEFDARIFESNNFVDFASLMHKKVYDRLDGLTEDKAFSALEDWDFFYAAANRGFVGVHIPEALYFYRWHSNSKSTYLNEHHFDFQTIKSRIMERNRGGNEQNCNMPSVSFVFAARTQSEVNDTIEQLKMQRYRGAMEFCYSTEGTIPQALNKAMKMAKNEVIVFIETDVIPHDPDWLRRLLYGLKPGSLVFSDEVTHTWYNWAGTACYRESLHGELLDESYPIAEDTEYFERLKRKHGTRMVRSDAVVYHRKEHESQKQLDRALQYGYLHAKLIAEYKYFPMEEYKKRLHLSKQIAEETLKGIEKYENEHPKS